MNKSFNWNIRDGFIWALEWTVSAVLIGSALLTVQAGSYIMGIILAFMAGVNFFLPIFKQNSKRWALLCADNIKLIDYMTENSFRDARRIVNLEQQAKHTEPLN
jgi:hypothetical protein